MTQRTITVKIFRFDPQSDAQPYYRDYEVPFTEGMSAMNALDYIYQNLDGSLAYYDHAGCCLGICARCAAKVNGKAGLLCQTPVDGDLCIEPTTTAGVIKDLVVRRKSKESVA
jgi:succinate dehydrogenase/fumarate reductase-like Fe-S protein